MVLNVKKNIFIECFVVITLISQPFLENYSSYFSFLDEIMVLSSLMFFLIHVIYVGKIHKKEMTICFLLLLLTMVGGMGNILSSSGQPYVAILLDVIANCKIFIFILPLISSNKWNDINKEMFADFVCILIRYLILFMFVCLILSQFINIGMTGEVRYGIASFKFLFENPAGLNTYCYTYAVLFSATIFRNGKKRKYTLLFMFMLNIVWILTLRNRAIVFSLIYIVMYFIIVVVNHNKNKILFKWYYLIPFLTIAVVLGWSTFEAYFIKNSRQVRYIMARVALRIAKDFFPYGSGFGTFGSSASRSYYSSIYARYGISNVWGISKDSCYFILDQYWFAIIGQFGILGTILVGCLIVFMYKILWKKSKEKKNLQLATLVLICTSLLSSISSASYIQASILISLFVLLKLGDAN